MHIIGTAGHVDHGKSSLVQALTGTNPDRWIEEQERGMTLDLGFAHLDFGDGIEAGIVDVPGHERFLHNMLAGAAGMEILLLVVAANEGVMPQTIEHLQILRYLNVQRVIVAVTKADLMDEGCGGPTCCRIHEQLHGTIAQDAGIFAVSTVTGYQLDVLKEALRQELASISPRQPDAPAYLPVDRVFTLPGRGTIVTGTLMQGTIRTGETLALNPGDRPVRVRSLQSFGAKRDAVSGGARVAINLPGIERGQLVRGDVLSSPAFSSMSSFDVEFEPVDEPTLALLKRRTPVRAYIGSAEILGTLVFAEQPTDTQLRRSQLHLRESTVAFPGVRFVVRRPSPKTLLGGGRIVGAASDKGGDRVSDVILSRDAQGASRVEGHPSERSESRVILATLKASAEAPLELAQIAMQSNLREEAVQPLLDDLVASGDVVRVAKPPAYVDAGAAKHLFREVLARLEGNHNEEPWALGLTSLALARALRHPEPQLLRFLVAFVEEGRIAQRSGYYSAIDHEPHLTGEQRAFFDLLVPIDASQPLRPAALADAVAAVKKGAIVGVARAFDMLIARGSLVKVDDSLYRGAQISQIHRRVDAHLREHQRMTAAEFRDLIGTSRKYAVPLLEWMDARGITVRDGDYRALRKKS